MQLYMLSIDIEVADEFPSTEDLAKRDAIESALEERGIGQFVGSGGGFGAMDLGYLCESEELAKQTATEVLQQIVPDANVTIAVEPYDGTAEDFEEDDEELSLTTRGKVVLGIFAIVVLVLVGWGLSKLLG